MTGEKSSAADIQHPPREAAPANIDPSTVDGFGAEWNAFDQSNLGRVEQNRIFDTYFSIFPFASLPPAAEGFDLGCGSGRWADLVADRVGILHCIDPSERALEVARRRLSGRPGVTFHLSGAHEMPLANNSQDFGYALGVLHHVPDTEAALRCCVAKLKPGAPLLLYLYYALDNRPAWFRGLWRASDMGRWLISRLPFAFRKAVTTVIACCVYWPLARLARLVELCGGPVDHMPLAPYRRYSFYTMRTDALDRFGTRLEHRFTRAEVTKMMTRCGLVELRFSETAPFWVACGRRG